MREVLKTFCCCLRSAEPQYASRCAPQHAIRAPLPAALQPDGTASATPDVVVFAEGRERSELVRLSS